MLLQIKFFSPGFLVAIFSTEFTSYLLKYDCQLFGVNEVEYSAIIKVFGWKLHHESI